MASALRKRIAIAALIVAAPTLAFLCLWGPGIFMLWTAPQGTCADAAEFTRRIELSGAEFVMPGSCTDFRYRDATWTGFVECDFACPNEAFDDWVRTHQYEVRRGPQLVEIHVGGEDVKYDWPIVDWVYLSDDQLGDKVKVHSVRVNTLEFRYSGNEQRGVVTLATDAAR